MTTYPTSFEHPVLECVRAMGAALDDVGHVEPSFMPTPAKAAALVELSRVIDRAQELQVRVLAGADDVAREEGARSAASWLAHHTRQDRSATAAAARLGEALDTRWHAVRERLSAGSVNLEQARAIARALEELPEGLDPEILAEAEVHLVEQAARFDPKRLRVLGRKVLEVVAPEVHEDHERRKLEAEEALARRTTALTMRRRGDGTTDIRIRVSDAVAGRLTTYLEAVTTQRLPKHGGSATSVVVTIPFDRLRAQVGAAGLATGEQISATEAMRLACTAGILPVVLGGDGQPLHLGRARRLFSCSAPGTTTAPTTRPTTRAGCPTATSATPGGHRWARLSIHGCCGTQRNSDRRRQLCRHLWLRRGRTPSRAHETVAGCLGEP